MEMEVEVEEEEGGGSREGGREGEKEWEGAGASLPQIHSVRKDGKEKTRFQKTANKLFSPQKGRSRACARVWRSSLNTLKKKREGETAKP